MRYLIDGHNLIGQMPGLDLSMVDDELRLVETLQSFARQDRSLVEVYFDQAPHGWAGSHRFGMVTAHFVQAGRTADDAIRRRLIDLGRAARQWVVVTSDRSVQAAAREVHAGVMRSEDFARKIQGSQAAKTGDDDRLDLSLDDEEVQDWLKIFRSQAREPKHEE